PHTICLYTYLCSSPSLPPFFLILLSPPPTPTLFPYTTLFRSGHGLHLLAHAGETGGPEQIKDAIDILHAERIGHGIAALRSTALDRKSTRLNSSHGSISYAVFCLKKKKKTKQKTRPRTQQHIY